MRCHSYHNSYNREGITIEKKTLVFIEASLSLLLLLSVVTTNIGHAQPSNGTQLWIHPENDVKILFTHSPKNPAIDTPSDLKFRVSNLLTGQPLKNLAAMAGCGIYKHLHRFEISLISCALALVRNIINCWNSISI